MKYTRLTKEQFEELHQEFINFLATQSITAEEWTDIKANKPQVAEEELDVFSDLVWEKVLTDVQYLDKQEEQSVFLFKCEEKEMALIGIRIQNLDYDLTTKEGMEWLSEHLDDTSVEIYKGKKMYQEERNLELFQLIQQGANIGTGEVYEALLKLV